MTTSASTRFDLLPDHKGAVWDLLLYVPTVLALGSVGAKLWFGHDQSLAYLLSFLACFFTLVGGNRVLKTRLLLLPSAPVRLIVDADQVHVVSRQGSTVSLLKAHKLYDDLAGKSFGLAGLNAEGKRLSFVFHLANFADEAAFDKVRKAIGRLQNQPNR
jgi:hypothetical protein